LLVGQILPVFSLLAPCGTGGAPNAAAALGTPGASAPSVRHRIYETDHSGSAACRSAMLRVPVSAACARLRRWSTRRHGGRAVSGGPSRQASGLDRARFFSALRTAP